MNTKMLQTFFFNVCGNVGPFPAWIKAAWSANNVRTPGPFCTVNRLIECHRVFIHMCLAGSCTSVYHFHVHERVNTLSCCLCLKHLNESKYRQNCPEITLGFHISFIPSFVTTTTSSSEVDWWFRQCLFSSHSHTWLHPLKDLLKATTVNM